MLNIIIGAVAVLILLHLGRSIAKINFPNTYICPEPDCHFEIRADTRTKVDEAVVSHWQHHPEG